MNLKQPSLGLVLITAIACNAPNEGAQPQATAPSGAVADNETASPAIPTTLGGSGQAAPSANTLPGGVTVKADPSGAAGADAKGSAAVEAAGSLTPTGQPAAAAEGVPGLDQAVLKVDDAAARSQPDAQLLRVPRLGQVVVGSRLHAGHNILSSPA